MSNSELISNAAIFALLIIFLLTFTVIGAVYFFNRLKRFNSINKATIQKSLEQEREKISNDLHDAASSLIAEFTSKLLEIKASENLNIQSLEKIDHLHNRIQDYNKELSHNIEDIYPKELLLNNWAEAIQSMAFRFQTNSCKIVCDFNPIPNFKNEIQIQSYRAIQEILTNIVKHNNPISITIQCYSEKNRIHVYFVYQFEKANALNLPSLGRGTAVLNNRLKFIKGELGIPQKINEQESFFMYETELKFTCK
jgi:signal transduction histidine kinase